MHTLLHIIRAPTQACYNDMHKPHSGKISLSPLHHIKTRSALLVLCEGNQPLNVGSNSYRDSNAGLVFLLLTWTDELLVTREVTTPKWRHCNELISVAKVSWPCLAKLVTHICGSKLDHHWWFVASATSHYLLEPSAGLLISLGTSNGSWCMGIKSEMSGAECVTLTCNIYSTNIDIYK